MAGPESISQQPSPREQEIVERERVIDALEASERAGKGNSGFSPERLRAMREAVTSMRIHHESGMREHPAARRALENEEQYMRACVSIEQQAEELEEELNVLYKYHSDPDAHRVYDRVRENMLKLRDRFEDLSKAVPADSPIRQATHELEDRVSDTFLRMLSQDIQRRSEEAAPVPKEENKLPMELYEQQVQEIVAEVISLERAFRAGNITEKKLQMLHDGLDDAQDRLQQLDEKTANPARSGDRRVLVELIDKLRATYPLHAKNTETAAALSDVRALHQQVKTVYASVSHALDEEQRRSYRTRIAQLTALVRHAEESHWRRLFAGSQKSAVESVSQDYFKSPSFVRAAASLALAKAGAFATTLGDALKLK
jgi:hypothetical protein